MQSPLKFWTAAGRDHSAARVTAFIFLAVAVGLIAVGWQGGVAFLWALACLVGGGTAGFLFGIPRTLQGEQPPAGIAPERVARASAPEPQPSYVQRVNTNLEQISDWLTKILVGLGLTQLERVPARLQGASAYIASGMSDPRTAAVFASAMIIYFSIVGFIGGYLLTRLFLAPAFRAADIDRIEARMTETMEKVQLHSDLNSLIVSSHEDLERGGVSPSLAEEYIRGLEACRKDYPTHRALHIVLGRLYDELQQYDNSIKVLSAFIEEKTKLGQASDRDTADVLYNRACAYSARSSVVATPEKEALQRLAVEDLRRSIALSPANKQEAARDKDFAPLRHLEEFKALVEGP